MVGYKKAQRWEDHARVQVQIFVGLFLDPSASSLPHVLQKEKENEPSNEHWGVGRWNGTPVTGILTTTWVTQDTQQNQYPPLASP